MSCVLCPVSCVWVGGDSDFIFLFVQALMVRERTEEREEEEREDASSQRRHMCFVDQEVTFTVCLRSVGEMNMHVASKHLQDATEHQTSVASPHLSDNVYLYMLLFNVI